MQPRIVMIQSNNEDLRQNAQAFHAFSCEVVATGQTGRDALELVREHRPDALIMDAFMAYYNCDEIAEILESEANYPLVKLALSNRPCDLLAERFLNNGGDFFLLTPIDFAYCARRIEQQLKLRRRLLFDPSPANTVHHCTRKYLMRMKMPVSILGYSYLLDAVEIALYDRSALHNMVTALYPKIAERHQVAPSRVERCIRTAVELAFKRGDINFLFPNFGHVVRPDTGKPTNSEFIGILSELVREELESTTLQKSLQ